MAKLEDIDLVEIKIISIFELEFQTYKIDFFKFLQEKIDDEKIDLKKGYHVFHFTKRDCKYICNSQCFRKWKTWFNPNKLIYPLESHIQHVYYLKNNQMTINIVWDLKIVDEIGKKLSEAKLFDIFKIGKTFHYEKLYFKDIQVSLMIKTDLIFFLKYSLHRYLRNLFIRSMPENYNIFKAKDGYKIKSRKYSKFCNKLALFCIKGYEIFSFRCKSNIHYSYDIIYIEIC